MRAAWIALSIIILGGGMPLSAAAQNGADPAVEIVVDTHGLCLNSPAEGPTLAILNCEPTDARQRWDLIRSSPTASTMKLRLNGTETCLAADETTTFTLRRCDRIDPDRDVMEWTLTEDRQLKSVYHQQCLRATARPITLAQCEKQDEIDQWTTRAAFVPPRFSEDPEGRYTLSQITSGGKCLTVVPDSAPQTFKVRFETCTVPELWNSPPNSYQLWMYSHAPVRPEDVQNYARIINAQVGLCVDFDGGGMVVRQCANTRESQVFRHYFESLMADVTVNNQRETICLMAGPDGALTSGFVSRRQCEPLNIWNNEAFKFASASIPFNAWSPPPQPQPRAGTVKTIEWVRVTPRVPASGISNSVYQAIAVAEWVTVVRSGAREVAKTVSQNIIMSQLENQTGVLPQGLRSPARLVSWLLNDATSPAYVLGRLDAAFSSDDDLYLKINDYVVWPEYIDDMNALARRGSTPHSARGSGETVGLHPNDNRYQIDLLPRESVSFSAWEWDSGSDNDLLAQITLSYDLPAGTHRFLLSSTEEHSVYEFEFRVVERPYWSCSGNIRRCTYEAPPLPRWPQ